LSSRLQDRGPRLQDRGGFRMDVRIFRIDVSSFSMEVSAPLLRPKLLAACQRCQINASSMGSLIEKLVGGLLELVGHSNLRSAVLSVAALASPARLKETVMRPGWVGGRRRMPLSQSHTGVPRP